MDRRSFASTLALAAAATVAKAGAQEQSAPLDAFIVEANKSRDGYPSVTPASGVGLITCKVKSSDTGGRFAIIQHVGPPNEGPPLHLHENLDEWFYVVEGEFLFEVGGKLHTLAAGASLLGPRNIPHRFLITGKQNGRLLVVFEPGGNLDQFFLELAAYRRSHPDATHEQIQAIWVKYHMRLLGDRLSPPAAG